MSADRTLDLVWGRAGLASLHDPGVCVIVDVLSFSTAVVAGCEAGACIYPYRWRDASTADHARRIGAMVAASRADRSGAPSLSPPSLTDLTEGSRLLLPSPNGSTLAFEAGAEVIIAGCLRNAAALADHLNALDRDVIVVAAGEHWPDGSLRVALEDQIGAGALVRGWRGRRSVAADAALAVFQRFAEQLPATLSETVSGRELYQHGYGADVDFAAALDVSRTVPVLVEGAFMARTGSPEGRSGFSEPSAAPARSSPGSAASAERHAPRRGHRHGAAHPGPR